MADSLSCLSCFTMWWVFMVDWIGFGLGVIGMNKVGSRTRQLTGLWGHWNGEFGLPSLQKSFKCFPAKGAPCQGLTGCGFDNIDGVFAGKIYHSHRLSQVWHGMRVQNSFHITGGIRANTGCFINQTADRIIAHHCLDILGKVPRITKAAARSTLEAFYQGKV